MTEILAPAGAEEQLVAAVRSGANAVYLGTKSFNARSSAGNFDEAALKKAVSYCHARGVKVHVTLNTLINDTEIGELEENVRQIAESGADAVIVQDLGVAKLLREMIPSIQLHASTQMTVTNGIGVKMAEKIGFSRAVLARELSIREIRRITDEANIEIETFIHGALCMSTSGACYLSSVIGGRSGNRGKCAQPCRLDFRLDGKPYALSLKDMSFVSHALELEKAGVCSFKIEGRMKRPEYVAGAVSAVRTALKGDNPDMTMLRSIFSRSGFTDGYYTGKRNAEMFGIRTKEDVKASAEALGKAASLYRAELQRIPVDCELIVKAGERVCLTMTDGTHYSVKKGNLPEKAMKLPIGADYAKKCIAKLGGTPFFLDGFTLAAEDGLTVPAAELNALRRDCAEELLHLRGEISPHEIKEYREKHTLRTGAPRRMLRVRFSGYEQSFPCDAEFVSLPLKDVLRHAEELKERYGERLVCELPQIVYDDRKLRNSLESLREMGIDRVIAENIGAIGLAAEMGFILHGGSGLNIMNSAALSEYRRLGICDAVMSFELSCRNFNAISGDTPRGVIGYGRLPLMQLRACPARGEKGCPADCRGKKQLTDRTGRAFPMLCNEREYTTLYNAVPLYIGDRQERFDADFFTLFFSDETKEEARKILRCFAEGREFAAERTRGLYFREIE